MGETDVDGAKMTDPPAVNTAVKSDNKTAERHSIFSWLFVLAMLGVWLSVGVVWFELVDYKDVVGSLGGLYDADGDGDFDIADAKVLLENATVVTKEKPSGKDISAEAIVRAAQSKLNYERAKEVGPEKDKELPTRDVGRKLKAALKEQLRLIHEKIEAKKIAKLALAEVRNVLAKEEEDRQAALAAKKSKEEAEAKLRKEQERIEQEKLAMLKAEKERAEKERLAKEKAEKERLEKERLEKERLAKEKAEKERLEKERLEKERLAKEKAEKARAEKEKLASKKSENDKDEKVKSAKAKLAETEKDKETQTKEKTTKGRKADQSENEKDADDEKKKDEKNNKKNKISTHGLLKSSNKRNRN